MPAKQLPNREILSLFKRELWKDQRLLEMVTIDSNECLKRSYETENLAETEVQLFQFLEDRLKTASIPHVISRIGNMVVFPYIRGIRVFNLFVELDKLDPPLSELGQDLKIEILARCERNQIDIQNALIDYPNFSQSQIYPAGKKILSMARLLAEVLGIIVNYDEINKELDLIDEMWQSYAWVPFRDATTKNMVLASPDLWLGGFNGEESRRKYLVDTLLTGTYDKWFNAPIVDFDFSSCNEKSTPEDDVISLKFHERTWSGLPSNPLELRWVGTEDPTRAALTFLVRYYRFGGRKAAYRLLHPWGHRIRFRHDDDTFYFQRLPGIITRLWPDSQKKIPAMLEFTSTAARLLANWRPDIDYFIAEGLAEKRRYYVDMYPE